MQRLGSVIQTLHPVGVGAVQFAGPFGLKASARAGFLEG
jgi:hypothetical protein